MISVRSAAEETAKALVDALQHAELTQISGSMSPAPDSQLRLAAGQIVRLNEGATVKIDQSSSVHVVGDLKVEVPQPSKDQLQQDATSASHRRRRSEIQTRKALERCPSSACGRHPRPLVHNSADRQAGVGLVLTHDSLSKRAEDAIDRAGVAEAGLEYALEHCHDRPEGSGLERR